MRLSEWQQQIEHYLLGDSAEAAPHLLHAVLGGPTLDAAQGLRIYHHAYRARLLEALRGDYPAVLHWLGDEEFANLAGAYLRAQPSRHFSLRWLGAELAGFIEGWLVARQAAPLAELARLEWAFTLAFDAAPGAPMSLADMAQLAVEDWVQLRLDFVPSVQCQPLNHNCLAQWQAVKAGTDFPASTELPHRELCLIWRQGLLSHYRSLAADEAHALLGMAEQGWSFAELCAELSGLGEGAPLQAATWLKQWISEGLLQRSA